LDHNCLAGNEEAPHALTRVQLFSFGVSGFHGRGEFVSGFFFSYSQCVPKMFPIGPHYISYAFRKGGEGGYDDHLTIMKEVK
jgi:hypothetical protein